MSDLFYRAFEEKFRGSRSLIRSRLAVYRTFISALKQMEPDARGLDLGCGRGEWLEVLQEEGIEPLGVDLDEGMLEACRALHLPAIKGDAVAYLAGLPSESQAVITAFHMVEHIPFEALQKLVQEALRVLVPGGLLIMETPNPENIQVGSHTFYYDPTHQRPIPPLLLAFLPEHYGFFRTKILRLQQDPKLEGSGSPNLMDVLAGTSPDYSVVAQKPATAHQLTKFDHAFETDHGLTLHTLATRYDARIEASKHQAQQAIASADNASATAQQAIASADNASATAQQAIASADNASATAQQAIAAAKRTHELIVHFEATLAHHQRLNTATELRINDLLNSTSWRATAPLRWASRMLRAMMRVVLLRAMKFVLARPRLRQTFSSIVKRFPTLTHHLHLMAIHRGLVPTPASDNRAGDSSSPPATRQPPPHPEAPLPLTPNAERMLNDLKTAIQRTQQAQNT